MPQTLVFATHNPNKASEVSRMMPASYEVRSLSAIGFTESIPETAETLEGNALLKARTVFQKSGYACFADDTGLEVDALNGEPGVYTARYAGERASDHANINRLLGNLKDATNRQARFRTIMALIMDDGSEHLFEGLVEGFILETPRGEAGFGYDPVFRPRGYDLAFAEMPPDQKNRISHRMKALSKLVNYLA